MPRQDNFSVRRLFIGVRGGLPLDPAGINVRRKRGGLRAETAQL